jgi:ribonuclease P protein component
VLPAEHRLRSSDGFRRAMRGRRAARGCVVCHLLIPPPDSLGSAPQADEAGPAPALVGFVVSKAVGGSVVRSQVSRRLRHVVRGELGRLPPGSTLVVRARPEAASATSDQMAADVGAALDRLLRASGARGPR